MIYLASPYSHPDPLRVQSRIEQTMECFSNLCLQGHVVFAPVLMTHETCLAHSMPSDAGYWEGFNTQFLRRSNSMMVLCIEGWATSKGVWQEISLAKQLRLPVYYINVSGTQLLAEELPA